MKAKVLIRPSTSGIEITSLALVIGAPVELALHLEGGPASNVYVNACRADFLEEKIPGERDEIATNNGQELLDLESIQLSADGSTWVSAIGYSGAINVGAMSEGTPKAIWVRATEKAFTSSSVVYCALAFRAEAVPVDLYVSVFASVEVFDCADSALNGVYAWSGTRFEQSAGNGILRFSGGTLPKWQLSNSQNRFTNDFGDESLLPKRGWKDYQVSARLPLLRIEEV